MRCLSILVTLFCLCINANADTKSEKVAELVEAQGLLDRWAAQIELIKSILEPKNKQ